MAIRKRTSPGTLLLSRVRPDRRATFPFTPTCRNATRRFCMFADTMILTIEYHVKQSSLLSIDGMQFGTHERVIE